MNQKLKGKDFITIGIFTVIYFAITTAVSMLGFLPIFIPLTAVLVPLVGGIPMMLYFSKVKKFGMITILSLLIGLLIMLTGMGFVSVVAALVFGLLADLMMKKTNYSSAKMSVLAHGVFSLWAVGPFVPIVLTRDAYAEMLLQYSTQEYVDQLMGFVPDWFLPVGALAAFVSGILGALIGRAIFKKHFERAGIL